MTRAGLRVVGGPGDGRSFEVEGTVELGRGLAGSPELSDPLISRRHARLSIDSAGRLTVEDLGSQNGTLVNGRVITDAETLVAGDVIDLGDTTLEVVAVPAQATVVAARAPAEAQGPVPRSRTLATGLPVVSARALIRTVRIRGAIAALAVTVVLWLALYVQLKSGDDPGLKSPVFTQPATGAPSTSTSSSTATTTTRAS